MKIGRYGNTLTTLYSREGHNRRNRNLQRLLVFGLFWVIPYPRNPGHCEPFPTRQYKYKPRSLYDQTKPNQTNSTIITLKLSEIHLSQIILFRISSSFFRISAGLLSNSSAIFFCKFIGRVGNCSQRSPSITFCKTNHNC